MEDSISINLWHGGAIEEVTPKLRYVGGDFQLISIEIDKLSFFELIDYVMETGSYQSKDFIMYHRKVDDVSLKRLVTDQDVIDMGLSVRNKSSEIVDLFIQQHPLDEYSLSINQPIPQAQPNNQPINIEGMRYSKLTARKSVHSPVKQQVLAQQTVQEEAVSDQEISGHEDTDSDDSGSDQESYDEEDVEGSDEDDDERIQTVKALKKVHEEEVLAKQVLLEQCLKEADWQEDPIEEGSPTNEAYSSYEESDGDVYTPGESEEDDIRGRKFKEHVPFINHQTDWKKFTWVVGIRIPSRDAFRYAVKRFAVANGRNLYIAKSHKKRQGRIVAKCVKGCPFSLRCSFHKGKECYMVKTVINKHTCQRNMSKNRQLSADFIATEFLPLFKVKPNWPAKEIQLAVKEKFKVLINKWLAYKAKASAHKKFHGSMKDHYSKIGKYLAVLRHANPDSTFNLVTAPPADPSECDTFFRLFVCFEGVKKGFLAGCRRVLCLDGCFLKTFLGGMLLAAVGRDANDQMFPLAWAVVEGENNDSWEWFMCQLQTCLEVTNGGKGWTLISDQQKGLLNDVSLAWRHAEHRNCARHIYANWHKTFKGEELKGVIWKAVRTYCTDIVQGIII